MNYRFSIQSVGFTLLSVGAIKDYLLNDFLTMLTRQYMRKMRRMILIDFNQNKDKMIDLRFDNTNHQILNLSTHHYQKMVKRLHNYLRMSPHIKHLEIEWQRYKYLVLERSPAIYQKIRDLLNEKEEYPVEIFYRLIDQSFEIPVTQSHFINAASHVFGYFKKTASTAEKLVYSNYLNHFDMTPTIMKDFKRFLYQLTLKYHEQYLIDSHYFTDLNYQY